MDFLERLKTIKSVAADNPPDMLALLELLTKLANEMLELNERIKKLEKEVG